MSNITVYEGNIPLAGKVRYMIDTITDDNGGSYSIMLVNASDVARNFGAANGEQALRAVCPELNEKNYAETYIDADTLEKLYPCC